MEKENLLHGYAKIKGVSNMEIALFLASRELPFSQNFQSVSLENGDFNFQRTLRMHHSGLAVIASGLEGIEQRERLGKRQELFYCATYRAKTKRAIMEFAKAELFDTKGKKREYFDIIMLIKPEFLYEKTIILLTEHKERADSYYHALRSEYLRNNALKRLGIKLH